MTLDPDVIALLDLIKAAGRPPMDSLPPAEARLAFLAGRTVLQPEPAEVASVRDFTIPGDIPVRLYRGIGTDPAAKLPCLVYYHGGGWVIGDLDSHDVLCRRIANDAGCLVLSVHYRLAPEHKFPAAFDDSVAAMHFAVEHADQIGADPAKIAVGGDSAGGNLAAVVALRARDEGGPKIAAQLLIYPVTDYHTPGTPSYEENADGYGLTRAGMEWFWGHYLADASHGTHPHASPLRANNLAGLPPAYVVTAEYDPLRDEGEYYGQALQAAGVPTEIVRCDGVNHGFFFFVGIVDKSGAAMDAACAWINRTIGANI